MGLQGTHEVMLVFLGEQVYLAILGHSSSGIFLCGALL